MGCGASRPANRYAVPVDAPLEPNESDGAQRPKIPAPAARAASQADFSQHTPSSSSKGSVLYPMYVLPVAELLELDRLPTHEDVKEKLVTWETGMTTLFVSQTWLAKGHPDNSRNQKLSLLKKFVEAARAGRMGIEPDVISGVQYGREQMHIAAEKTAKIGFVWFDIVSVPQHNRKLQAQAISSIHKYVANSDFFLCIAGAWEHEDGSTRDVRAWCSRGWCRVEMLSNALSPRVKPLIVMQSQYDVRTYGAFTVEADKYALGPVLEGLIDECMVTKLAEKSEAGWRWYRALYALKRSMLAGTGVEVPSALTLEAWMAQLKFSSPTEADSHGWAPLRYASLEGRVDLATELLDAGADIDSNLTDDMPELFGYKNSNNLFAACVSPENAPLVRLLLERGADQQSRTSGPGDQAFGAANIYGHLPVLKEFVAVAPQRVDVEGNFFGMSAICFSVMFGHRPMVDWLVERDPDWFREVDGGASRTGWPLGWLATASWLVAGDVSCVRMLLDTGLFNLEQYDETKQNDFFRNLQKGAWEAVATQQTPPPIMEEFSLLQGTALHVACYRGNLGLVKLFLERGADLHTTKHHWQMTPLHAAAIGGCEEVCAKLLQAGARADARDHVERTPAMWAARRGYDDLVPLLEGKRDDMCGDD